MANQDQTDPTPSKPPEVDQSNPSGAEAAAESEESLSPMEQLAAERDELKDSLLRSRAELDNFRKRMNRERTEERRYAALPVIQELLPVIDNLQRAIDAGQQNHDADALLEGVQMVLRQMEEVLSRQGLKAIPAVGTTFDPNFHEALQQVPTEEHPAMTVMQEYERGFQLHDRVVRPSKVIVAGSPPEPKQE